jgi:hypothetical protein
MINSHCYHFEYRNYKKGFLDSFVDITYVITLEKSNRMKNIENQLLKYTPTKYVYIVFNKGYKKCNKILYQQSPPYDLKDAYFNIIKHSIKNNYNNILILEDDFIFNPKITNIHIINEIKLCFELNKKNKMYFNLGPIPLLFYPNLNLQNNTYRGLFTACSQSIIYNKNIQLDLLKKYNDNTKHWDLFLEKNYINYFYKFPLCYQIFPETENQKHWLNDNIFQYMIGKVTICIIKQLKLNLTPNPGYEKLYSILFIFNYIVLIIIIYYLCYILYKIYNKYNIK